MALLTEPNYQSLFESAPGLYLVLLPDFTIAAVSDAYLKATMTERVSITGHGLFEIFPDNPDDVTADGVLNLRASLNYVLEHKQPHTMAIQKYDIRRPDGVFEVRYWSPLNSPVLNEQNEVLYIIHNVIDVTVHQNAEKKLEKSEKDYQLLISSVKDYAIFMVDLNGLVASWNSGAESIKGYTAAEIIGRPIDIFYTEEEIEKDIPRKNLQAALQLGHIENEGWRLRKDGTAFWANVVITALKDEAGKLYGYSKITKDITERKKGQEELESLSRQINQANDSIYTTDANRKIKSWNRGAEKLYGYTKDEMMGKDPNVVFRTVMTEEEIIIILKEVAEKHYWTGELQRTTKEGRNIWVRTSLSTVRDDRGEITGYVAASYDITDRKKAEAAINKLNEELEQKVEERTEAITRSEKQYRYLFENNPMPMWVIDLDTFKFLDVNEIAVHQYGYSRDEFLSMTATDIRPDGDKKAFKESDHSFDLLRTNYNRGVWSHRKKNGTIIQVQIIAHEILFEGMPAKLILANDITEQRKLEELLNKANTLARIGSWEVDLINETVYWSDITKEIHEADDDYIPDLATGLNFYKEGKGKYLIIQKVKDAIELGKPWDVELQIITAKNNEKWIRTIGETEFADGKCVRIYGSFQDIDDRKKAEEKLAYNEARFRTMIENISDAIVLNDADSNILYQSPSVSNILGYQPAERQNKKSLDYVHPESRDEFIQLYEKLKVTPNKPLHFQYRFLHKSGRYVWLEGVVTNLLDDPIVNAYVANYRDVTERKAAEESIKQLNENLEIKINERTEQLKKTNQELEAFSYSVSHDLRAPLRGIIGFTSILEEEYGSMLDDEAKRITGIIKSNTLKMGNLIDDLLAFSRISQHEMEKMTIDNNELVKQIITGFENQKGIIEWIIAPLQNAYGDYTAIRQVWVNLISNAVKYSSAKPSQQIEVGCHGDEHELVFFVKDNGAGFDEKYAGKLFKIFQRLHSSTEFEGTGIGLAIVEKIISKHGGRVWAAAKKGEGAIFYFSLPKQHI